MNHVTLSRRTFGFLLPSLPLKTKRKPIKPKLTKPQLTKLHGLCRTKRL